jgi:hypothetical protein
MKIAQEEKIAFLFPAILDRKNNKEPSFFSTMEVDSFPTVINGLVVVSSFFFLKECVSYEMKIDLRDDEGNQLLSDGSKAVVATIPIKREVYCRNPDISGASITEFNGITLLRPITCEITCSLHLCDSNEKIHELITYFRATPMERGV